MSVRGQVMSGKISYNGNMETEAGKSEENRSFFMP